MAYIRCICYNTTMNLYHALLTDHYRNPRHFGALKAANLESALRNPSCGDEVHFWAVIVGNTIENISFEGKGCVISLGSASLLAQHAQKRALDDLLTYNGNFMQDLIGMPLGPVRLKCALLPLEALQAGIQIFKKEEDSHARSCQIEGETPHRCR